MRQLSRGGLKSYLYRQVGSGLSTRETIVNVPWDPIELPPEKREDRPWLGDYKSPQDMAFDCEADVLGYGGAAGGAKTDLIIAKAVKRHHRSLILRREFTQLKGAIERAKEIIGRAGRYNSTEKLYRLPGGKRIEFGGVEHEGDEEAWQGRDHDFKAIDEATHFLEKSVRYLTTWLRTTRRGQLTQLALTFNPPLTSKGAWVVNWFKLWLDPNVSNPAQPGELRWFVTVRNKDHEVKPAFEVDLPVEGSEELQTFDLEALPEGAEVVLAPHKRPRVHYAGRVFMASAKPIEFEGENEPLYPLSRTFIPARTTDNPHLTRQYLAQLDALPEPLRSMYKYGRFDALSEDEPWQVFPTKWVRAAMQRRRNLDRMTRGPLTALGVDVARGGLGETVIYKRFGTWFDFVAYPGSQTKDGPEAAAAVIVEHEGNADILVDVGGPGGSPYDSLKVLEENPGFLGHVLPINFAEGSSFVDRSGRLRMANMRAAMHWNLRQMLDPDFGDGLELPDDDELLQDLLAVRWKLTARGVQIEDKGKLEKETGRGFHHSDACILSAWLPEATEVSSDPSLLSHFLP